MEDYRLSLERFFDEFSTFKGRFLKGYTQRLERFFNDLFFRYRVAKEVKRYTDRFLASDFNLVGIFCPDETRISGILALLLNPRGEHGQGELFLEEFVNALKGLLLNPTPLEDLNDFSTAKVSTEVSTDCGRLDILVEFPNGFAIAIENKPWAGEQFQQLERYVKCLDKTYEGKYLLLFLSGSKREAVSLSGDLKQKLQREGKFLETSYGEFLKPWLLRCAKECESDKVRWFLRDFASWIEKIFGEV